MTFHLETSSPELGSAFSGSLTNSLWWVCFHALYFGVMSGCPGLSWLATWRRGWKIGRESRTFKTPTTARVPLLLVTALPGRSSDGQSGCRSNHADRVVIAPSSSPGQRSTKQSKTPGISKFP